MAAIKNALKKSTNAYQKTPETVFSIAICSQSGDKWQSKTQCLIVDSVNIF